MLKILHHWSLPLLSAFIWWGMLIALMACWAGQGHPVYQWMQPTEQKIMYISDIAASNLQPIFISCAGAQGLLFALSLAAELYLRGTRRLPPGIVNRKKLQIWLGVALGCAIVGELGILFVSIFNTRHFHKAHRDLLIVFIVFVGVSSLSSMVEYGMLGTDYPHKRHVVVSLAGRIIWFCCELALAIAFACIPRRHEDAAAVCEWVLSFIYPAYQLIMVWDLWPAYNKSKGHYPTNHEYPIDPSMGIADTTDQYNMTPNDLTAEKEQRFDAV